MVTVGRSATTYLTLPLVGAGIAAVRMAADFGQAMANVNSIMKIPQAQLKRLSDQVLELSTKVPQSAKILAEGLYSVASAGYVGQAAMKVLTAAARAASAGMTDTETAAKGIIFALKAYGLGAKQAAAVSDTLFKAVDKGILSFEELAQGMGDWVAIAAQIGVPLEDAAAALAAMTLAGVGAAEASTSLARLFTSLAKPTNALKDVLKEWGYASGFAALQSLGLQGVIEKLGDRVGKNKQKWFELLGEQRAVRGAFALTANDGKNLNDVMAAMDQKVGATSATLKRQAEGPAYQFKVAINNLQKSFIDLGNTIIPIITRDVIPAIQKGVKWFDNLSDSQKGLIVKVLALAAVLGPASMLVGGLLRLVALPIRAVSSLLSLGTAISGVGTAARTAGPPVATLATRLARFPALVAGLAAIGAGLSALADSNTDIHKTAEALGLTARQIDAIAKNVKQGGAEKSLEGFFKHLKTGITGGFDKATLEAARAMVDVVKELASAGVPLARAQELVNRAFMAAAVHIDGTKQGLEEFKQALRDLIGFQTDAAGKTKLNYFALQRLGNQYIASGKAAHIWNEVMTRSRLMGDGVVRITQKQSDSIAQLIQRLSNLGGNLTEGQRKWLAVRIAAGDYNAALEILRGALERARKRQKDHNDAVGETTGKFRTARAAAQAYDEKIRNLPKEAKTRFFANTTQAERDILRYRAILYSLPSKINTRLYVTPRIGQMEVTAEGGIVRAQAGLITRGPTILAGEGNYSTFAGKGAEMVTPLDSRGIGIMARAFEMAMQRAGKKGGAPPEVYVKVMLSDRQLELLVERIVVDINSRTERAVGAEI